MIIPTYNRAEFILDSVKSVLNQSYTDLEVLVVDDGSIDDTASILAKVDDSRLRYLIQENRERGAARNLGIKNAEGDFLVFLDSDDHWHENHLSLLYEAAISHSEIDLFATKYELVDHDKRRSSDLEQLKESIHPRSILFKGNPFACHFAIRNKSSVISFREERELAMMEDWIFLLENSNPKGIYVIDEVTVEMRDHSGRSMNVNHSAVINARLCAVKFLRASELECVMKVISAYSFYFCSVHAYIDFDRKRALIFLLSAIKQGVIDSAFLTHLIKCLLGKKLATKVSRFFK